MKRFMVACLALGLLAGAASAQTTLAAFVGYGNSAFETDAVGTDDSAGYIPLGVQGLLKISPALSVGAEFNYAVVPFTWEVEWAGVTTGEVEIAQTIIGALAKYEIGEGTTKPHLRGGVGMYMGGSTYTDDVSGHETDADYKSAIGFNFGGGVTADWGRDKFWLAEFVYHIVSREIDEEGAESFGANNWAVQLGAGMTF